MRMLIFDKRLAALAIGAAVIGAGSALSTGEAPAAAPAAPSAGAPAWQVLDGSSIGFRTSWSGSGLTGGFKSWTAAIRFDPAALDRSSVRVTVDLGSVFASYDEANAKLPEEDWFNVPQFPQAVFAADRFEKVDADHYRASGTLSIKGISKPLVLPFSLKIDGDKAVMDATVAVDRMQYGLGLGDYPDTTIVPGDAQVEIKLTAQRQG